MKIRIFNRKSLFVIGLLSTLSFMQVSAKDFSILKVPNKPLFKKAQTETIGFKKSFTAILANQNDLNTINTSAFEALNTNRIVIHKPNASYIKIHFDDFAIPQGSRVEVKNANGSQVHSYGGSKQSSKTKDINLGDDGIKRFSALSIVGDIAIVEYIRGTATSLNYRISIDHVMQGFSQSELKERANDMVGPRSTCGEEEREDVQCWANSHPTEFERTRPVAKLLLNGASLCTAWRVGENNHLFTNNHCVADQAGLDSIEVWFNYQNTECNGDVLEPTTIVAAQTLLQTDFTLDYTLFTVADFNNVEQFGYFGLEVREAIDNERIYIPQHGAGNPKEMSIESDRNSDGLCRVNDVSAFGRGDDTDIGYMCDTTGGSSGSPVLVASSNNVIALHHFGGCNNQGIKLAQIWPQVSDQFGGVIPVGDNDVPNDDPAANFNFSSDQLVVTFTDTSNGGNSDLDSWDWDFGDGNSSTSQNPTNSYAAAGSYSVILTVTNTDGLSDSSTQTVVVTDDSGNTTDGFTATGLSPDSRENLSYTIDVPAGATSLQIDTSGGTGDVDLIINFDSAPTRFENDCIQQGAGNTHNCTITDPAEGTWFIIVRGVQASSDVQLDAYWFAGPLANVAPVADFSVSADELQASFTDSSSDSDGSIVSYSWDFGDGDSATDQNPIHDYAVAGSYTVSLTVTDDEGATGSTNQTVTVSDGSNTTGGFTETGLAPAQGENLSYTLDVPAGATSLDVDISGGTGNADLVINFGSAPTRTNNDCIQQGAGNAHSCSITNPSEGTWFIIVRGTQASSDVQLDAYWNQ